MMRTTKLSPLWCIVLAIAQWLTPESAAVADPLSPEELRQLLEEVPMAHEGAMLAISSYNVSYKFQTEILEDGAAWARAMRARAEHHRGPPVLPPGSPRIHVEEWLPQEFDCKLIGTVAAHKLTYCCLLKNSYDQLPVGSVAVEIRSGENLLDYSPHRRGGLELSPSMRLASNYLSLLNHLPTDIPHLQKAGYWGTKKEESISGLFARAKADPAHYEITASREKDVISLRIIRTFDRPDMTTPGAGLLWKIEIDAGKSFAPLFVARRPGRRVDGIFKEYGYGDNITFSSYVEPSPGIWMPKEIVAVAEGRLKTCAAPGEVAPAWNRENLPLEATMRISRHSIKVKAIEVNGEVSDEDLTLQGRQDDKAK